MRVAALQYCASSDLEANLVTLESMLEAYQGEPIELLVLPENFAHMALSSKQKLATQETLGDGPVQQWLSKISKKYKLWLVAGSFPIVSDDINRPYARCLLYNPKGELATYYDKIHLFDVAVSAQESYCESNDSFAGNDPVILQIEDLKVGLSICYDLRFPELYRFYQQQQVDLILAPSAFTYETGKAHWDLLIKARAVENLCFVVAPNQTGTHDNSRKTYGHSKIISPWGKVLQELRQENGIIVQDIQKQELVNIRRKFPAHTHRKL